MAAVEVACPGCQATLKAPANMAGKKAKCKKCGVTFRIPGGTPGGPPGGTPAPDTGGDDHFLGGIESPAAVADADNPFDFSAPAPEPPPPPRKVEPQPAAKKSGPVPKPAAKPAPTPPPPKPAAKAPSPPKPAPPKPKPSEPPPEPSASEPLSLSDDDPMPAAPPADAGDPFAFDPAESDPAPVKTKAKGKSHTEFAAKKSGDPAVVPKAGYRARVAGGGIGRLILVVAVFGLVVGGVVGGVLIYMNVNKGGDPADAKKSEDRPGADPAPPAVPPAGKGEAKATDLPAARDAGKTKAAPRGPAKSPKAVGMLALPPGKPIEFTPLAAKPEEVDKPSLRLDIIPTLPAKAESAFPLARRVFPPLKRDIDVAVLWQVETGFQGRGEKLLLGVYSPQSGKQVNQVEVDGDGQPNPACDLSVSADVFAHAHRTDGKVTVFNTRDGSKVIDGFAPYADMKDRDYKLAAVFLTEPPDTLVTVSATGVVHAWKVPSKEPLGEYTPPTPAARPLVGGKSVAPGVGRQSVVMVVAGAVYEVAVKPAVAGSEVAELGGEVGRSLGLAVSGGKRVVYAFETDADGKKEKAVMELRADGKHLVHKWPDKDAGEPVVAGWVGDDLAMVGTDRGAVVWFEAEGTTFRPIALARTPGDMARHVASDGHWVLLPDPADRKKCLLLEFSRPQEGLVDPLERAAKPATARLDDKGLFK